MSHPYQPINKHSHPHPRIPTTKRLIRLSSLVLGLTIGGFFIVSLIAYLSPLRGATRPCLPFSLHRLSSSAHRTFSCSASQQIIGEGTMAIANGGPDGTLPVGGKGNRLGDFLLSQREAFLGDIKGGNLKGWTVVMGNEAGGTSPASKDLEEPAKECRPRLSRFIHSLLLPLQPPPSRPRHPTSPDTLQPHAPPTRKSPRFQACQLARPQRFPSRR